MTDPNSTDQERQTLSERICQERKKMTKRILNLTLEIIYLLTGEDYTVVKKTASECMPTSHHPCASGHWSWSQSPIMELPQPFLILERKDKKILEVTNKITELLTGEVPLRCQDVTVYFSMEEWEYLEGHKDLYKEVIKDNHPSLTTPDGSRNGNTPERCPRPLYSRDSQDSIKEHHNIPQDDQDEDLIIIKVEDIDDEDTYKRGDELCMKMSPELSRDGRHLRNISDEHPAISPDGGETEDDIASSSSDETPLTANLYTTDLLSDPSTHGQFPPDCSPSVTHHTSLRGNETCFTEGTDAIAHRPAHAGEMPYSCSECGKYFPWKALLIRHQRTHTGEKPFACSVCGKCFAQKSILVRHEKVHVDEKPFSCSECGKCFRQKSDLAIHERVHTAEKPFSCPECGQCFTQRGNLMSHLRRHTGVKPFSCSECGKCFSWKMLLIKHQRTHTGEKPYSCVACGKCFTDKANLLQHERIHTAWNAQTSIRKSETRVGIFGRTDVMMEKWPHLTSLDGSRDRNTPERCPLYSWDSTREHQEIPQEQEEVPQDVQDKGLVVKVEVEEEPSVKSDEQCKEEEIPPEISTDESRNRNTPERCPRTLYSWDSTHEHHEIPQEHHEIPQEYQEILQYDQAIKVKDEAVEPYVRGDEWCKEKEIPPEISTDGQYRRYTTEKCSIISPNGGMEDEVITPDSSGESPITPTPKSIDPSPDPSTHNRIFYEHPFPLTHHETFPCSECGKSFMERAKLTEHQRTHIVEKPYSCSECGKRFSWQSSLISHEKVHTGKKSYTCSACGKCFSSKDVLITHQRIHTGEKPFLCLECGKRFRQKSDLAKHQRTHTGEKPFSCLECGECFTQRGGLVMHHRTHSGEKPYSCAECGKCFTGGSNLAAHQRIHTGDHPYSCPECGRSFTQKSDLIRHETVHTGDRPFLCPECGKGFANKSDLVRHKRVHTGDQPFSCSECGKRYAKKSSLISHLSSHR